MPTYFICSSCEHRCVIATHTSLASSLTSGFCPWDSYRNSNDMQTGATREQLIQSPMPESNNIVPDSVPYRQAAWNKLSTDQIAALRRHMSQS